MFELPKGFELPKPANDNFAEAEQRRMSSLEGSQKTIEEVRDWMHKKREQLVSSSSSEAKDLRAQEVESVLEMLESGESIKEILENYPSLTKEHIKAALKFAAQRVAGSRIVSL